MSNKKNLMIILFIGIVFLVPITRGSAAIVWSEDFEAVPPDWDFYGYDYVDDVFVYNNTAAPSVENGVLKMPNTQEGDTWSHAVRTSTVAYGTWSFDWMVPEGTDHESLITVFIMINDMPRDFNGTSLSPPYEHNGYFINIKSGSAGPSGLADKSIRFGEYITNHVYTHIEHVFDEPITGAHHITITRDTHGEFNIYFDSTVPVLTYIDLSTKYSELCIFGSWYGDSVFDNITVSSSVDYPTTTVPTTEPTTEPDNTNFPGLFFLLGFGILVLLRRKRET